MTRGGRSALALLALLLISACSSSSSAPGNELGNDQTLRVAIPTDVELDPARILTDLDYSVAQNLFGGLYRFDDRLQEQPDLAAAMPQVSPDGLVYTIKLRTDAEFGDGHPVTAQDVVYSWNRALDENTAPVPIFQPVVGYQEVEDRLANLQTPLPLRGLSAPDSHTVVLQLSTPAGYLMAGLALPAAWVLNQADVEADRKDWTTQPNRVVGTGPFRLTSRALGRFMTLVPVEHWWHGTTGWLKKVDIEIVPDKNAEVRGYIDGHFDLIGLGGYGPLAPGTALARMLAADPQHSREVHRFPYGRTDWLGFDVRTGPFAGPQGLWGRRALSLAVDRTRLAKAVCAGAILCTPATGGLISKGLAGYLGEGSDPMSSFDPRTATADLQEWDPDRTMRQHLTYFYVANSLFRQVAENLRDQWKANLGITVQLQGYDTHTFLFDRFLGDFAMFRGSWAADYNSPQDWYDSLFVGDPNPSGSGYADPSFLALVARADASSGVAADGVYRQAGDMLLEQAVVAPLFYYTRAVVMKGYVDGFGANAFYVYRLTDVRILQH